MYRVLIFIIAGWSGFFVMAIELLSGRILAPNFGSSIYVWGGVITVFMLALSIGYLLGGRLSMRAPSLRKLAAILAFAALATIPVAIAADAALDRIFELVRDPRYGSLLSSTLLFFVPTVVCGMVSPYAVRLLVDEARQSGHRAGQLYFVSTFGSAAGTISTAFYLVLYLEINQIIWTLAAISAILAVIGIGWKPRNAF